MARPTWDEYYMSVVGAIALRATCDRGKSGALIVRDNRIISSGYVGSPKGQDHCDDVGHKMITVVTAPGCIKKWSDFETEYTRISAHCIRTVHAEMNAICNAALHGASTVGSVMYCTMVPCYICAKSIVQCGIIRVLAKYRYQDMDETVDLFKDCGVELEIINNKEIY